MRRLVAVLLPVQWPLLLADVLVACALILGDRTEGGGGRGALKTRARTRFIMPRVAAPSMLATLAAVAALAIACGTTTSAGGPGNFTPCRTSADCVAGTSCQFAVYQSCGTFGSCLAQGDGAACIDEYACGCDGQTRKVCVIGGNVTTPIQALGACDGASLQMPFPEAGTPDAEPMMDSTVPPIPDAGGKDASDASPIVDTGIDAPDVVDAADAAEASTPTGFGISCTANGQADCTDPNYNQCFCTTASHCTCTKLCSHNSDCAVPPTTGHCDLLDSLLNLYCE